MTNGRLGERGKRRARDGARGDEAMTKTITDRRRGVSAARALTAPSVMLGACNTTGEIVTQTVPTDYRQRHPIAVEEAKKSIVIFVGKARRGPPAAPQRGDARHAP